MTIPKPHQSLLEEFYKKNLPYPKNNVNQLTHNKTFWDIQQMDDEEFSYFCDNMRQEILNNWNMKLHPPIIGKREREIEKDFDNLIGSSSNRIYVDENYPKFKGFIKDFGKIGSSCIQFFPSITIPFFSITLSLSPSTSTPTYFSSPSTTPPSFHFSWHWL